MRRHSSYPRARITIGQPRGATRMTVTSVFGTKPISAKRALIFCGKLHSIITQLCPTSTQSSVLRGLFSLGVVLFDLICSIVVFYVYNYLVRAFCKRYFLKRIMQIVGSVVEDVLTNIRYKGVIELGACIMKLDGIGLFVNDMATMVRVYRDVLRCLPRRQLD